MREDLGGCWQKLAELEGRQEELLRENLALKELCLALGEEWGPRGGPGGSGAQALRQHPSWLCPRAVPVTWAMEAPVLAAWAVPISCLWPVPQMIEGTASRRRPPGLVPKRRDCSELRDSNAAPAAHEGPLAWT